MLAWAPAPETLSECKDTVHFKMPIIKYVILIIFWFCLSSGWENDGETWLPCGNPENVELLKMEDLDLKIV